MTGSCSDNDTLTRARTGDRGAFTELVRRYQRTVFSIALRMLSDRHKAEDLAQEVFLQLHRKLSTIESDAHLAAWLRKVTANRAIDRLRQAPQQDFVSLEDDIEYIAEHDDDDMLLRQRLSQLIGQLSTTARAVIVMRYQEDLDPNDIARTLDMPVNTVKSHLRRSLATLRSLVSNESLHDSERPDGELSFRRREPLV